MLNCGRSRRSPNHDKTFTACWDMMTRISTRSFQRCLHLFRTFCVHPSQHCTFMLLERIILTHCRQHPHEQLLFAIEHNILVPGHLMTDLTIPIVAPPNPERNDSVRRHSTDGKVLTVRSCRPGCLHVCEFQLKFVQQCCH